MPSQIPSPTRNPLSKTEIVASDRGTSRPLIEMRMSRLRSSGTASWVVGRGQLSRCSLKKSFNT